MQRGEGQRVRGGEREARGKDCIVAILAPGPSALAPCFRSVTREQQTVRALPAGAGYNAGRGGGNERVTHLLRRGAWIGLEIQRRDAYHVRRGHRRTTDGIGGRGARVPR